LATPHQVTVGNLLYTVVDDCTTTYWAILTGSVADEILGDLYAPDFTVDTGRADLPSKTTANGLFAVTGYPDQSFPNHSSVTYPPLSLDIRAAGFRELTVSVPVPAGAPFPIVVPPQKLRRLPVRIQGRVVDDLTRAPYPGSLVLSVDNPTVPPTIHTTALRTPLYFDHPTAPQAQFVNLGVPSPASLTAPVSAGDKVLNVNTRTGLGAGSIVQLSSASNVIVEYGVMDHLSPGPPASAGQVFLKNPLNRSYASGLPTTVQYYTPTPVGLPIGLSADANAGDGVLLAPQLLNGATPLVVDPGTLIEEYHEIGALTDSDGYYGLDGMGRVQEIFLFSSQGAVQQTVGWFIEYDNAINVVDLRLS
jgi:hypothetical protein